MRSFLAVLLVGLAALVAVGLTQRSDLVYSLGVNPTLRATQIAPGGRACQGPVRVPSGTAFDRVGVLLDPLEGTGPPVEVEVREAATGRRLASGGLDGGYGHFNGAEPHVVPVGRVQTDEPLELCLLGAGDKPVAVVGQAGIASPVTTGTLNGKPLGTDLFFDLRDGGHPLLALLPKIADRASRFRAGWVTPGVYLVLALLIVVAAPVLLARGLRRAAVEDGGELRH